MPTSPALQAFVDDELARSAAMAERNVALTLAQLQQPREGMLSPSERQHYFELVQALQKQALPYRREFCETLRSLVAADMSGQDSALDVPLDAASGLALLDDNSVEVDIEVSRASQLIDSSAEWELRELQTFTSTLAGQKHVSADTNPMRPLTYARALWQGACAVTPVPVQRAILLRTAAGVISGQLKMAWAGACTRLESQGVEPGIYRTVVLANTGVPMRTPEVDITQPGALEELLPRMPEAGAAPDPTAQSSNAAHSRSATGPSPALEEALSRLDDSLRRATPALTEDTAPAELGRQRATLLASTSETVDKQIVELLSRLFEAVLSDLQLPAAFRTLMARLQVSALRVALVDRKMLEKHDHPVWRLMNRIALAGETYSQTSDPRMAALLAYCEALVDDMARAAAQDALLYRQSLARLDSFLAEQLREQQLRAQPTIEALTLAERREDMQRQLSLRLTEQMAPLRTSATIRRFVTGAWAKVMADAMVRYGENEEPAVGYILAADELLWSLRVPNHPQSRKRLIALLPGLLQRLRAGMALIGLPGAEQRAVLDELLAVHSEALHQGQGQGPDEPDLSPQEIVQRLREESTTPGTLSQHPFSEPLIDLSSMETVPAELMSGTPADDDPAKRIEAIATGSRYRLFLHGRWIRTQLLWRSVRGQFFLFAGEAPGRTHSVTRQALERMSEEGLVKPLEEASLLQRAVDALVLGLSQPA